ncbi:4-galactosyl-N-acetylglucosaminide 3-alpha-L-fucosyltransferase 9-like [Brachyhypopomus gauderio]|uniref:4-galactosyl-N-acetylglucosaminide 3-alpha-L-fucosyltransferase 9-like n=1 Tax=Brachyhypopomus gauderio TaxID=698409 RepID=UPI0040412647
MMHRPLLGRFHHFYLVLVLLLCSVGLFCLYFKSGIYWLPCPEAADSPSVCTDVCLAIFRRESATHLLNSNCTLNYSAWKQQKKVRKASRTISNSSSNGTPVTNIIVLIWTWPFAERFDVSTCDLLFGIKDCYITDNARYFEKAHAVMFHHNDILGDLPHLLQLSRPSLQKWVWMNMESPVNSLQLPGLDNLFNLTSNYRRDSDVWVPYGWIVEASDENKDFQLPKKDKLVCWFVNNWDERLLRVKYFNEFSKHIKIETYGGHFHRYLSKQDYFKIMSVCKFYLSFENSIYKDYITEKLFNPLTCGTVPVVLGPPRKNYEEFVPGDSFIHVDDFTSPQELAEHLKLLDQNQEMYEQYFTWRKHFTAKVSYFGLEHACRICDYLRKHQNYRVFNNLNKWYWG